MVLPDFLEHKVQKVTVVIGDLLGLQLSQELAIISRLKAKKVPKVDVVVVVGLVPLVLKALLENLERAETWVYQAGWSVIF